MTAAGEREQEQQQQQQQQDREQQKKQSQQQAEGSTHVSCRRDVLAYFSARPLLVTAAATTCLSSCSACQPSLQRHPSTLIISLCITTCCVLPCCARKLAGTLCVKRASTGAHTHMPEHERCQRTSRRCLHACMCTRTLTCCRRQGAYARVRKQHPVFQTSTLCNTKGGNEGAPARREQGRDRCAQPPPPPCSAREVRGGRARRCECDASELSGMAHDVTAVFVCRSEGAREALTLSWRRSSRM